MDNNDTTNYIDMCDDDALFAGVIQDDVDLFCLDCYLKEMLLAGDE